jgi:hypothetical protein
MGATFQMRTVLYEIHLFNDRVIMHNRVFISKQIMRGETERESVRERALLEIRDSIGNKIDRWRKYLGQMCEIN